MSPSQVKRKDIVRMHEKRFGDNERILGAEKPGKAGDGNRYTTMRVAQNVESAFFLREYGKLAPRG